jgi:hypothetical protein
VTGTTSYALLRIGPIRARETDSRLMLGYGFQSAQGVGYGASLDTRLHDSPTSTTDETSSSAIVARQRVGERRSASILGVLPSRVRRTQVRIRRLVRFLCRSRDREGRNKPLLRQFRFRNIHRLRRPSCDFRCGAPNDSCEMWSRRRPPDPLCSTMYCGACYDMPTSPPQPACLLTRNDP